MLALADSGTMVGGLVLRCLVLMYHGPSGTWALDLSNPVLRILGRDHRTEPAQAIGFSLGMSLSLGQGSPMVVLLGSS